MAARTTRPAGKAPARGAGAGEVEALATRTTRLAGKRPAKGAAEVETLAAYMAMV